MKMTRAKKPCRIILCMMLLAVAAFAATGCGGMQMTNVPETPVKTPIEATVKETVETMEIGTGERTFPLEVTHTDGAVRRFLVHTDEETVGAALVALGIVRGEEGPYGLFIKTVDGETVDYDADGQYWAFYENGAYANAGVDTTGIAEGASYALRVQR